MNNNSYNSWFGFGVHTGTAVLQKMTNDSQQRIFSSDRFKDYLNTLYNESVVQARLGRTFSITKLPEFLTGIEHDVIRLHIILQTGLGPNQVTIDPLRQVTITWYCDR